MHDLSVSVFFPCYNEQANVERTTLAALDACRPLFSDFEIIIVNDGSTDRTGVIADGLATEHDGVRAVHNRVNLGYGGAVQLGLRESRKDWIFYTDGDGQFDVHEISLLVGLLDRCDIAVGYRLDRKDHLIRKLNAWCWTTLCNRLFHLKVRDIDCAFKLLPRRLLDQIPLHSTGALISAELLARAARQGYRIAEVGVHHYPRIAGTPTGANPRVILRAFAELFKLRRRILEGL
jgi:glycosyltransferase involved in cell wall biosynthesis